MPVKVHKTTYQGHRYAFNTLTATKGLEVFSRIMAIAGDAIAEIAPAWADARKAQERAREKGEQSPELNLDNSEVLQRVARALFKGVASPDFGPLIRDLVGEVHRDDKPVRDFDQDFAGEYGVLLHLTMESLRANFMGFLAGSAGEDVLAKVKGMTQV